MTPFATLFATACIAGTLHGQPNESCQEIAIAKSPPGGGLSAVEACELSAGEQISRRRARLLEVMPTAVITFPFHRCTTVPPPDDED